MAFLPPVARLALVFAGGVTLTTFPEGLSLPALAAVLAALAPIPTSSRPDVRRALLVALVAGVVAGLVAGRAHPEGHQAPAQGPVATRTDAYRGRLLARAESLYGDRAPVVGALVLAERRGLDPALREDFARSGTAHLLAISGFHVGVVAGLVLTLLRGVGVERRRAGLAAAAGAWGYVTLLGFPDAASRAALILTVAAASRARGRPPARWGGLGTALLVLVALDPTRLASPGFQLSFAGAAGLAAWAAPFTRRLRARGLPEGVASPVAAGVAATLATLPVVAWHFERVSLVGIPATLLATPLVVVALPGALASLLLEPLHPGAAGFLAGGVGIFLEALARLTQALAEPDWASLWVPRAWVTVGVGGALAARTVSVRLAGPARRWVWAGGAAAAVVAWPGLLALQARGTAELVMVDVGQGDAVAIRTPGGRWLLVDAGPPWPGEDAGGSPLVRALRRRGVRRLEALVLTHPDLDHIGGAGAVLEAFPVGFVLDPGRAAGKAEYVALLERAAALGVPWHAARAGARSEWDGVTLEVLHPPSRRPGEGGDTNDLSVVLLLRFGGFEALLTGDAPAEVERRLAPSLPAALEVLKVGHHGSATSTDDALLTAASPAVALISVGARNRYGHPAPEVLGRLGSAGVEVHRTDLEGSLALVARPDGAFTLRASGRGRR